MAAVVGFSDGAIVGLDLAMHHPDRITRVFAYGANSSVAGKVFSKPTDPVAAAHSKASDRWCEARYKAESPTPDAWPQLDARAQHIWQTQPNYTPADPHAIYSDHRIALESAVSNWPPGSTDPEETVKTPRRHEVGISTADIATSASGKDLSALARLPSALIPN